MADKFIVVEVIKNALEEIENDLKDIILEMQNLKKIFDNGTRFKESRLYLDNELKLKESSDNPVDNIKQIMKSELSQISYDIWIANCKCVIEGDVLRWFCPNTFSQDIVDKRYIKLILNACKLLELNIKEVEILVENEESR